MSVTLVLALIPKLMEWFLGHKRDSSLQEGMMLGVPTTLRKRWLGGRGGGKVKTDLREPTV